MSGVVELIKQAKGGDQDAMQRLLDLFEPKVKRCVSHVPLQDREEMEQSIRLEMIVAIHKFDLHSTPTFWDVC
ncbi:helix-turn-helix domain-containing protein [Bacillus sp. CGMCC 1.16541]|uniref:helix-turn-helix domain-containing protein n=1 Tax=Bacillus sp. CGMCC 1.16541 TaxID=2185143 RepID=UPI000D72A0EE|nr:helix-turn-helix domain-containing protein [Bacillus sp. CGMCC 1.16541]